MDLRAALPHLLPKAIAWAEEEALRVATSGRALTADEITLARNVGVVKPELIRIQSYDRLPVPQDPECGIPDAQYLLARIDRRVWCA